MQICQLANIHICPQCPCKVFCSEKKLAQHCSTAHHNTRVSSNLDICAKHVQGQLPPNYNPIWQEALLFIHRNYDPDPPSFRAGLAEKVPKQLLDQFDDIFGNLIVAETEAAHTYIGQATHDWNSRKHVFFWLICHAELLLLGPQKDKSETIGECIGRRINLFRCGYIEQLWNESRQVRSRKPGAAPASPDAKDKAVQDAADKDCIGSAYARAVKPQKIATITSSNRKLVTNKYPPRITPVGMAALQIILLHVLLLMNVTRPVKSQETLSIPYAGKIGVGQMAFSWTR